jgi:hypothetical protein
VRLHHERRELDPPPVRRPPVLEPLLGLRPTCGT